MSLICPICQRAALPAPPPSTSDTAPGIGTRRVFVHPDGSPLCPTSTDGTAGPSWPDDTDTWLTPAPIPTDAIALPRRHPCRLTGTAIAVPIAHATVVDAAGGIDCPATTAAAGCPLVTAALPHADRAGLAAGGGCWLRAHAPHRAIAAAYRAGVALPHRVPGFAYQRLDPTRTRALAHWLRRYHDTILGLLPEPDREAGTAVLGYTAGWLDLAAASGGGVRTARLALLKLPPRGHGTDGPQVNRPAAPHRGPASRSVGTGPLTDAR